MLKKQRFIAFLGFMAYMVMGISLLLHVGPTSNSAASLLIRSIFPDELWPFCFIFAGLCSGISIFFGPTFLRVSYYTFSVLLLIWGIITLGVWFISSEPQPSSLWLIQLSAMHFLVAQFDLKTERIREGLQEIKEQLIGKP